MKLEDLLIIKLNDEFFIPKLASRDSRSDFKIGIIFFLELEIFLDNSSKRECLAVNFTSKSLISISTFPESSNCFFKLFFLFIKSSTEPTLCFFCKSYIRFILFSKEFNSETSSIRFKLGLLKSDCISLNSIKRLFSLVLISEN